MAYILQAVLTFSLLQISNPKGFPFQEFKIANKNFTYTQFQKKYLCNQALEPPIPRNQVKHEPPDHRPFGKEFCCSCSMEDCMKTKSCCIDALWDPKENLTAEGYIDKITNTSQSYKDMTCEDVYPLASQPYHKTEKIFAVSTCMKGARKQDIENCLNIDNNTDNSHIIPVFGDDNYFYKNTFCAKCNFVNEFHLVDISATCYEKLHGFQKNRPLLKTFQGCKFKVAKTNELVRKNTIYCRDDKIINRSSCHKTSKYYKLCMSYYGIFEGYANYHCFLCAIESMNDVIIPTDTCAFYHSGAESGFWSFTLDFSKSSQIQVEKYRQFHESLQLCQNGTVYNMFTGTCSKFECLNEYQATGIACKKNIEKDTAFQINSPSFDRCFSIQEKIIVVSVLKDNINDSIISLLEEELFKVFEKPVRVTPYHMIDDMHTFVANISNANIANVSNIQTKIESSFWNIFGNIFFMNSLVYNISSFIKISPYFIFQNNIFCAQGKILEANEVNFTSSCDIMTDKTNYSFQHLKMWMKLNNSGNYRNLYHCHKFYLHAPCHIFRIQNNFSILANKSLVYKNKLYLPENYTFLENNGIGICLPSIQQQKEDYDQYKWMKSLDNSEFYIQLVLSIISILCYTLIITLYLYITELRTMQGLTVVGLCGTSFAADMLSLIGDCIKDNLLTCKVFAIIIHWCLLSAYCWLVAIAIDLVTKFGTFNGQTNNKNLRKFFKYCVFAFTIPTILMGIAVVLDVENVYDVGYGEFKYCFIANLYPKIIFFVAPVGIAFIISLTAFVKAFCSISAKERKMRKVLTGAGRKRNDLFAIAIKLALILGITEICGFIRITRESMNEKDEIFNAVFGFIYGILRSSRGILLFVVNVCNEDKRKVIEEKFIKLKENVTEKTQLSDTNGTTSM